MTPNVSNDYNVDTSFTCIYRPLQLHVNYLPLNSLRDNYSFVPFNSLSSCSVNENKCVSSPTTMHTESELKTFSIKWRRLCAVATPGWETKCK